MSDPDNYRGITLLNIIGKLFTALINRRLKIFLESNKLLGNEQAGFRAGFSTMDHIFTLHMLIELYKSRSKKLWCAFVDYKKAFDLVDRTALWRKVIGIGVKGRVIQAVINMYGKAKSCVKVNGKLSDEFICNMGVRQGENLSPLLFAIFLNDFSAFMATKFDGLSELAQECRDVMNSDEDAEFDALLKLFVLLYADDTIILADSHEALQSALDGLSEYCEQWKLTVNTDKTKVVVFSRGHNRLRPVFLYRHTPLQIVKSYVYLGVEFHCTGKLVYAMAKQISQASRAMNALLVKAKLLGLSVDLLLDVYGKTVLPVLFYGCEVWGAADLEQAEVFHRKFLRRALEVGKVTQNVFVYGETGATSIKQFVVSRMVSYWFSLVQGDPSRISAEVYRLALRKHMDPTDNFRSVWMQRLEDSLVELGLGHVWDDKGIGYNAIAIKASIHKRSSALFDAKWQRDRRTDRHGTYQLYQRIKPTRGLSSYLVDLGYFERRAISRFFCRCNRLPISDFRRYRYEFFVPECPLCGDERGDELHYIFRCPAFEQRREAIGINATRLDGDEEMRLVGLTSEENTVELARFARFLHLILRVLDSPPPP